MFNQKNCEISMVLGVVASRDVQGRTADSAENIIVSPMVVNMMSFAKAFGSTAHEVESSIVSQNGP